MINPIDFPKLMNCLNKFVQVHPRITDFIINQGSSLNVGDEIEFTFKQGDSVTTKKMKVMESDVELFKTLKKLQ